MKISFCHSINEYLPTIRKAMIAVIERSCLISFELVLSTSMVIFTMDLFNMSVHMVVASDADKDLFSIAAGWSVWALA